MPQMHHTDFFLLQWTSLRRCIKDLLSRRMPSLNSLSKAAKATAYLQQLYCNVIKKYLDCLQEL